MNSTQHHLTKHYGALQTLSWVHHTDIVTPLELDSRILPFSPGRFKVVPPILWGMYKIDGFISQRAHSFHIRPQTKENWASRPLCHT